MGWCAALLLASAADPLFAEVVHADAVVVGTVTALGPAIPFDHAGQGGSSSWRVAEVRVEATWLGPPRPTVEWVAVADVLENLQPPWSWRPLLAPGRRVVLLLTAHTAELPNVANYRSPPTPESPAGQQVRHACGVFNDPLRGLTAPTPAERYFAAALLVERYAMWRPIWGAGCGDNRLNRFRFGGQEPLTPAAVPAEQSRLILRAIAERTDWTTTLPGLKRPGDLVCEPDAGLGLTVADGWTWPQPALTADQAGQLTRDLRERLPAPLVGPLWPLLDALDRPLPPLPPVPVPSDDRVERIRDWLHPWYGPLDFQAVADADRVRLTRAAFDRWLDGPGGRCVLRTTAGALRPPPTPGGWGR